MLIHANHVFHSNWNIPLQLNYWCNFLSIWIEAKMRYEFVFFSFFSDNEEKNSCCHLKSLGFCLNLNKNHIFVCMRTTSKINLCKQWYCCLMLYASWFDVFQSIKNKKWQFKCFGTISWQCIKIHVIYELLAREHFRHLTLWVSFN